MTTNAAERYDIDRLRGVVQACARAGISPPEAITNTQYRALIICEVGVDRAVARQRRRRERLVADGGQSSPESVNRVGIRRDIRTVVDRVKCPSRQTVVATVAGKRVIRPATVANELDQLQSEGLIYFSECDGDLEVRIP